ncbi:MAG TPA: hypothetical protein EYH08_03565 [Pyrodictium sp.]|nr:hypothetical protein [Pyrodictium sp.]
MEPYPIIRGGKVVGSVVSGSDFTIVEDLHGGRRTILWFSSERGAVVDRLLVDGRVYAPNGLYVDVEQWVEVMPFQPYHSFSDIDSYLQWLVGVVGDVLRGKKVVVGFSGGKDSLVASYILSLASEKLGFKLILVYSHVPFLESEENRGFVEKVANRLGVELVEVEPPKPIFREYMFREGLPYRGTRWCTYLKVRPIREFFKKIGADYLVSGDRLVETLKRFRRLIGAAVKGQIVAGKHLRPTFTWTIMDVVRCVRSLGLVHPDYLRGLPRVSCSWCPYKCLFEFTATQATGWEDLIEKVLRREYRLWYQQRGISWDEFRERRLWRYTPKAAQAWNAVMNYVEKLVEKGELEEVEASSVRELYRSMWVEELPKLPVKTLDEILEELHRWVEANRDKIFAEDDVPPTSSTYSA